MSLGALGDLLLDAADRDPAGTAAVSQEGEPLTYADLARSASAVAAGLARAGVEHGDRVLLAMPNGLDMCRGIFGVALAGAAFMPVNPTMKRDKMAAIMRLAEPSAALCDDEREQTVRDAADAAGAALAIGHVRELEVASDPPPAPPLEADLAAIMFTSGSTGEPKGVMLTHRNMRFATESISRYLGMTARDRVLSLLPLSFGYGLSQLLCCVRVGGTLVLAPGLTFPGRLVQNLEEHRITGLPAVPTVLQVLTSLDGLRERELPDLRYLTSAGASLPAPTRDAVLATFPRASLFQMYGQTECTRVCYLPPDQVAARPESVGIAIPGTETWIERGDGSPAAPGEVGELFVRGAHVMQGYWRDPEGSEARLRPGRWPWERVLATGDLFRADEDGYLYFVARSDDIIKSRGEKVAPKEVEDAIYGLEGVHEVAVVGVPDLVLGEAVHAHLALGPGAELDASAVRRHCATALEDHMVPRQVHFHEALPRTPNGKLDKISMREASAAELSSS